MELLTPDILAVFSGVLIGLTLGLIGGGGSILAVPLLVYVVGIGPSPFLRPCDGGDPDVHLDTASAPRLLPPLAGAGLSVGALSGFFGIGGGFLIVPGLITVTAMPILNAVGSSLVSVTVFGLTTSTSYALSGLVDWRVAAFLIGGGAVGAFLGQRLAGRLSGEKQLLSKIFAVFVIVVGLYVTGQGVVALL